MSVNILLIIVLAVFVLYGCIGYHKGFVKMLLLLCAWIFTAMIAYSLTPHVSGFLKDKTPIYSTIEEKVASSIKDSVTNATGGITTKNIAQMLKELSLPTDIEKVIQDSSGNVQEDLLESMDAYNYIAGMMADYILNAISFVLIFIIVDLIFKIFIRATNVINKIPILGMINKICGLVAGIAKALILVWIAFAVITICMKTDIGMLLLRNIQDSVVLRFLYNNDIFINMILKAM